MTNQINYKDLKLGEKAVEMYKNGSSIDDIAENSAVYLNTKENFNGLNNTDMIIANVLAGGNTLLVGRSGCGKSQLTKDIHNYYFGGSVDAGGKGLTIEGDVNSTRQIWTANSGLSRAFLYRGSSLYSNDSVLAYSYDFGRVVLVSAKGANSQKIK